MVTFSAGQRGHGTGQYFEFINIKVGEDTKQVRAYTAESWKKVNIVTKAICWLTGRTTDMVDSVTGQRWIVINSSVRKNFPEKQKETLDSKQIAQFLQNVTKGAIIAPKSGEQKNQRMQEVHKGLEQAHLAHTDAKKLEDDFANGKKPQALPSNLSQAADAFDKAAEEPQASPQRSATPPGSPRAGMPHAGAMPVDREEEHRHIEEFARAQRAGAPPSTGAQQSHFSTISMNDVFESVRIKDASTSREMRDFIKALKSQPTNPSQHSALNDEPKVFAVVHALVQAQQANQPKESAALRDALVQLPRKIRQNLADAAQNKHFENALKIDYPEMKKDLKALKAVREALTSIANA